MTPVVPPKKNRKDPLESNDKELYQRRNGGRTLKTENQGVSQGIYKI
jgi:hypothetical protein